MSTNETALVPQAEMPLVHLVARNPIEMQQAREGLIAWLKAKIESVATEIEDYRASLNQAIKNKWNKTGLQKAINNALYRKEFYEKTFNHWPDTFTEV